MADNAHNERFTGFCYAYDKFRPNPPVAIFNLAAKLSKKAYPKIVIDLGCGTGLSTRPWAKLAQKVIGIDPSEDMLKIAQDENQQENIAFLFGTGEEIPVDNNSANIITCSSSVHWMKPDSLMKEIDRTLQPEGVFMVYGHYFPVYAESHVLTKMHEKWRINLNILEYEDEKQAHQPYSLSKSLTAFDTSGVFNYTRKLYLHSEQFWNRKQIMGFMEAHAGVPFLRSRGYDDEKLLFSEFKKEISNYPEDFSFTTYFTYSVYFGIKKNL
jgi:ubiquinone/menaquinone biosynthesis C-methylase UbiE